MQSDTPGHISSFNSDDQSSLCTSIMLFGHKEVKDFQIIEPEIMCRKFEIYDSQSFLNKFVNG
jgi:hypothetical protein